MVASGNNFAFGHTGENRHPVTSHLFKDSTRYLMKRARPVSRTGSIAILRSGLLQLTLTSIAFGFALSFFGITSSSTPLFMAADIFSGSTDSGKANVLLNFP